MAYFFGNDDDDDEMMTVHMTVVYNAQIETKGR